MSLIRVVKTASATLARTFYIDETASDTTGLPTVVVTRLDGTAVVSGTAVDAAGTGVYTYVLPGGPAAPASATWQLDTLVVTWTGVVGGATVTFVDYVQVVGGFYFGLKEARDSDASLSDPLKYPTALLAHVRLETEVECERICGRAFVPRFARRTLNGSGWSTVLLPDSDVRTVRAVAVAGVAVTGSALTAVKATPGALSRTDGAVWPCGTGNAVVEYEYGLDFPPPDLADAALLRFRTLVTGRGSGVPLRTSSYTTPDGQTFRYTMPGQKRTGIPEVDSVYADYSAWISGIA